MAHNQIAEFLENGADPDSIVSFLLKNSKKLGPKIRKLLFGGLGTSEILQFLQRSPEKFDIDPRNFKPSTPEEIAQVGIIKGRMGAEQPREEKALGELQSFTKRALQTGTALAGLYGGGRLLSQYLGRGAPQVVYPSEITAMPKQISQVGQRLGLPAPKMGTRPATPPQPTAPIPPGSQPQGVIPPGAPAVPAQPETPPVPNPKNAALIKQMGIEGVIQNLAKKEDPSTIARVLEQHFLKPAQRKWLSTQTNEPLDKIVEDYLSSQRLSDKAAFSPEESRLPSGISPGVIPSEETALRQQERPSSQISTAPSVGETKPNRAMTPSTLEGPMNSMSNLPMGSKIPNSNRIIRQKHENFNDIFSAAEKSFPSFKKSLDDLKNSIPGISLVEYRIKDRSTAEKKSQQKGEPNTLGDYIGGRIGYDNEEALNKIKEKLGKIAFEQDDFINSENNIRDDGYRAIHYQIPVGNGVSAEVQVMPREIADIHEKAHALYNKWKRFKPSYTAQETNEKVKDYLKMRSLFDQAWEKYQTRGKKDKENAPILSPKGDLGQIESSHKGISTINVDGKKKQFHEDDLIKSPLPEKDLAQLYEDLVQAIPESERSAMINVAGYDPNHNELIFMPHDGALYVYKDIPEEFADKLKSAMFQAKTTGENFYGAWAQGEASRGAGLFQLIRELQKLYGGKGKEYVRKYEKVYDLLALPKAALKERERKEREEKRIREGKKPRKPRQSS